MSVCLSVIVQLGVKHMVVFVNKCDVVEDKEVLELVSAAH